MPSLTRQEKALFNAVLAAVLGAMANKGRATPAGTAHRAAEFAIAAVEEARIRIGKRTAR